jgi:DNA invertase Pin-like site-specific DNA recombinase
LRWKKTTGTEVIEGYGLTEASPVLTFNPTEHAKPGSIGAKPCHRRSMCAGSSAELQQKSRPPGPDLSNPVRRPCAAAPLLTPPLRLSPSLDCPARSNIRRAWHEAERSKTPTLRDLHPQIDRAQSRSRLQLARRPAESCEAYIKSQAHEGWTRVPERFDDGGLSGASLDRPALQALLDKVRARKIDIIVVYKVDRLTRSLADFAKLVELFDEHEVSFVSVTQSFNTTSSMGRLTLNVLLSFAQFEREVIGERVRDKIAASKSKGIWVGGPVPLGYRSTAKKLEVVPEEAALVQKIFAGYLRLGSIGELAAALDGVDGLSSTAS